MDKTRADTPAFPRSFSHRDTPAKTFSHDPAQEGMTIREHLSGMALSGILSNNVGLNLDPGRISLMACEAADALLLTLKGELRTRESDTELVYTKPEPASEQTADVDPNS